MRVGPNKHIYSHTLSEYTRKLSLEFSRNSKLLENMEETFPQQCMHDDACIIVACSDLHHTIVCYPSLKIKVTILRNHFFLTIVFWLLDA